VKFFLQYISIGYNVDSTTGDNPNQPLLDQGHKYRKVIKMASYMFYCGNEFVVQIEGYNIEDCIKKFPVGVSVSSVIPYSGGMWNHTSQLKEQKEEKMFVASDIKTGKLIALKELNSISR